jgi:hypothetical protein
MHEGSETSNLINILFYNIHKKCEALGIKFLRSCKVCCESLEVTEKV